MKTRTNRTARLGGRRYGRTWPILAAAVLVAALLAWFWHPLHARAVAGASFGARIACSCHFVAGRDLSDCRKDFEPGMETVMLSADEAAKSVTARYLPLAARTATYREGFGCVLEPDRK